MSDRSTVRYTYQDYLSIPEDSSRRHEIVDGELFVTPAPRLRHQQVVGRLLRILMDLTEEDEQGEVVPGPVTVRLHEEGVVEPDLIFVAAERLRIVNPDEGVDGPPDLVVEVLSPSNREFDRKVKRKHYMEHGVPELWIVDADEGTVEVWRPGAVRPRVVRHTLEWKVADRSFEIPLSDVFPR
ncbi:MAG: Uma2 family endonuclease [Gemmatimonadota bacterium]